MRNDNNKTDVNGKMKQDNQTNGKSGENSVSGAASIEGAGMEGIRTKIVVLSGKGGVGKSTVSTNIAVSLALAGMKVGLMDVDIHGPSVPKLLGIEDAKLTAANEKLIPVHVGDNLKVISIGFMLQGRDDAVIWRGPLKMGVIKQFINDVYWEDLDCLVVDCPPGTGDEPLSVIQLLEDPDGAVIVTTPQEVALTDVRKSVNFCKKLNLPVVGVVENMSGFVCPHCGERVDIFKTGGGKTMAKEMDVPFLGSIPLDPSVVESGDKGQPFVYHFAKTETAKAFEDIIRPLTDLIESKQK